MSISIMSIISTSCIALVLAIICFFIIRKIVRDKKNGSSSCSGCSGNCNNCHPK